MASSAYSASTASLKLSDAISMFSSQTATMYQLWAFYTATVLGSLVFGFSRPQTTITGLVFLVGYWTFALGELALLTQTIRMIDAISRYIMQRYSQESDLYPDFGDVVSRIRKNTNPLLVAVVVQLVGNLCVTFLVMASATGWITIAN